MVRIRLSSGLDKKREMHTRTHEHLSAPTSVAHATSILVLDMAEVVDNGPKSVSNEVDVWTTRFEATQLRC